MERELGEWLKKCLREMDNTRRDFYIAGRIIGPDSPPYCIAEAGINHNGDLRLAKQMIDVAKEAGADAVKFQTFRAEEFCGDPGQMFTYASQGKEITESMLEMFRRYEFSPEQWREISEYCRDSDITFFSTPQNLSDLELLINIGIPAIKIGSDDLINLPLLKEVSAVGLPLLLSCGMSDLAEVHNALECTGWFSKNTVAVMLCTSQYPTPLEDVNLRKLLTLQMAFPGLVVGFSDHTQGYMSASLAVACGARIFEKHFTLDHDLPGPDHWFSENAESLKNWIDNIKGADAILGKPYLRPTHQELAMRTLARRSVVALQDIQSGERLGNENVGLRRPGDGLPPAMLDQFFGLTAARNIQKGERLGMGDGRR